MHLLRVERLVSADSSEHSLLVAGKQMHLAFEFGISLLHLIVHFVTFKSPTNLSFAQDLQGLVRA